MVRSLLALLVLASVAGCGSKEVTAASSSAAPATPSQPTLDAKNSSVPVMPGVTPEPGGPIQPGMPGSETPAGG